MNKENWLRTDEWNDAVLALEFFSELLDRVIDDIHFWKWTIITLHSSLQGFMVASLRGSDGHDVLKVKADKITNREAKERAQEFRLPDLVSFPRLYCRIKSDKMLKGVHSVLFTPNDHQDACMETLNILRNDFIHFKPLGWSIDV
ncbi:MAG: hypothetical protein Q8N36_02625, partial [bacterium]|nr:hypothetical protein [bacterium]